MAENAGEPGVSGENLEIGSTDAGEAHADEALVRPRRYWTVAHVESAAFERKRPHSP